MTTQSDLLAQIEAFLPERKIKATTFGRLAVGDSTFVDRLREGRTTLNTMERAAQFIRQSRSSNEGVAA